MNYGDQQHQQYMVHRMGQDQRMPMSLNGQGVPIQPNQQAIRPQQPAMNSAVYSMQQMPQAGYAQHQMRMVAPQMGMTQLQQSNMQQQRLFHHQQQQQQQQQQHSQSQPHVAIMGGGAIPDGMTHTPQTRIMILKPSKTITSGGTLNDYLNQLPAEFRQQIQAEPDPERRKALIQNAFRSRQIYEQQQRQQAMNIQQQQLMAQRQQQQQQQHPSSQAQVSYIGANTGGGMTVSGASMPSQQQQQPAHMQRIPSQGSFTTQINNDGSNHQMSHSQPQPQQMPYGGGGRVSVGAGQQRSFSMTTHHAGSRAANASPMSQIPVGGAAPGGGPNSVGSAGGLPPTMTLQQMNSQQQQQFFQHQQHLQHQHQMMQQQQQQYQQKQNAHNIQANTAAALHSSQSQPQLHQIQQPSSVVQPQQQQQLNNVGGPGAQQVISHRVNPMTSHNITAIPPNQQPTNQHQQPHSVGSASALQQPLSIPHQQPRSNQAVGGGAHMSSGVSATAGGPASVPSQHSINQKPLSIPPSSVQQYTGSPLVQQQQQQSHGGRPSSVSSIRPTTPSIRSMSSMGAAGPNSVGVGVTQLPSSVATTIDQNAPEYRAALDQLKAYGHACRRLLIRLRTDGMEKLLQSVERVIEIIEGRRIVDLKFLRRLIQKVCSTVNESNPTKGLAELSNLLGNLRASHPSIKKLVPDIWNDIRHLQIRVPDALESVIRAEEKKMEEANAKYKWKTEVDDENSTIVDEEKMSVLSNNTQNGSRKRKLDSENANESSTHVVKRDCSVLKALATSFSDEASKPEAYCEVSTNGTPLRVECLNESFIQLNANISKELACLRQPYRFDPDYKPISDTSPHVQIIVGYKSNTSANSMASWIPPLRLIIPVDYPLSNVQIFEDRLLLGAEKTKPDSRDLQAQRRRHIGTVMAQRANVIFDELKMRLDSKNGATIAKSTTVGTGIDVKTAATKGGSSSGRNDSSATKSTQKSSGALTTAVIATQTSASIGRVVSAWTEVVERFVVSNFKSVALVNNSSSINVLPTTSGAAGTIGRNLTQHNSRSLARVDR